AFGLGFVHAEFVGEFGGDGSSGSGDGGEFGDGAFVAGVESADVGVQAGDVVEHGGGSSPFLGIECSPHALHDTDQAHRCSSLNRVNSNHRPQWTLKRGFRCCVSKVTHACGELPPMPEFSGWVRHFGGGKTMRGGSTPAGWLRGWAVGASIPHATAKPSFESRPPAPTTDQPQPSQRNPTMPARKRERPAQPSHLANPCPSRMPRVPGWPTRSQAHAVAHRVATI